MYRIMIVEDDEGIARGVSQLITAWGMEAVVVQNFQNVVGEFAETNPQLVLMDIGLPFMNGYHWCSEIRRVSQVPIIFLSSASDNMNIIMAMNMGADDFIPKPFDGNVLIAKIQALLRRTYSFGESSPVLEHRGFIGCLSIRIKISTMLIFIYRRSILFNIFFNNILLISCNNIIIKAINTILIFININWLKINHLIIINISIDFNFIISWYII